MSLIFTVFVMLVFDCYCTCAGYGCVCQPGFYLTMNYGGQITCAECPSDMVRVLYECVASTNTKLFTTLVFTCFVFSLLFCCWIILLCFFSFLVTVLIMFAPYELVTMQLFIFFASCNYSATVCNKWVFVWYGAYIFYSAVFFYCMTQHRALGSQHIACISQ